MAIEPKPTRRPALYARRSSDQQNVDSVPDQLERLKQYLLRNGEDPTHALVFSDSGLSGERWETRPGVQALMAAVRRREVSCVYAEDLDRIAREEVGRAKFAKLIHYCETVFLSVSDGAKLDGSTQGDIVFTTKAMVARHSTKATADKSQRGLRANAAARKTTGGRTYGYARTKIAESAKGTAIRRNDIDPEQAAVVRLIFERYAQGIGYAAIAAELNAKGTPAPQRKRLAGGGWAGSCIREMLRNARYVGDWTFGRREWSRHPDTERRVVRRMRDANNPADAERLVKNNFPELAIIDRPLWEKVQAKLATHAERYARREVSDRKSSYLLTGLLRCAVCGSLMQIAGGTLPRYRCAANAKRGTCENSLSIREATVREQVVRAMGEELSKPANLDALRERTAALLRQHAEQKDEQALQQQAAREMAGEAVSKAEARLKKLYLRWADSPDDTLDELMKELRAEIAGGRAKLAELDAQEADLDVELPTAEAIEEATQFVASLGFLNELDAEPFPDGSPAFADGQDRDVRTGKAREALRVFLADGIKLTPATDAEGRFYFIDLAVLPLSAAKFQGDKRRTAQRGAEPYDNRGCAGAIRLMGTGLSDDLVLPII